MAAPSSSLDLDLTIADGDLEGSFEIGIVGSQNHNVKRGPRDLDDRRG